MGRSVLPMATRIAPILPVTDLAVALEHYRRLGFSVRAYPKGGYGFATLDQVEIHLGVVPPSKVSTPDSVYLFVDDADELAQAWRGSGADVRFPVDTEWGMHGRVVIDPDGNVIRFGPRSPPDDHPASRGRGTREAGSRGARHVINGRSSGLPRRNLASPLRRGRRAACGRVTSVWCGAGDEAENRPTLRRPFRRCGF
jgi:catechol 2,3-dioxygenase-like lactoylglutathione lyase family enzyme